MRFLTIKVVFQVLLGMQHLMLCSGPVEPPKVRYEVHHDETEINELYSMNLLMDLKKGDLIVLE